MLSALLNGTVATFLRGWLYATVGEKLQKSVRDATLELLHKSNGVVKTTFKGKDITLTCVAGNNASGVTAKEAATVEGIGPAMLQRLCVVSPKLAKAQLEAGCITDAQFEKLVSYTSFEQIRVSGFKPGIEDLD